jgi:polyferredoxin
MNSLSLLFGCIAITTLLFLQINKMQKKSSIQSKLILKFSLFFISSHVFFWGIKSWITPSKWPAYLPPITLISFGIVAIAIMILYKKPNKELSNNIN